MKRNKEITTYQRTWKKKKQRLSFSCSLVVALACVVERGSCVVRIQRQRMSAFLSVPFLALCLSSQVSPCSPAKKKTKLHSLIYTQTEVLPGNTKKIALVIVRRARGLGYGHLARTPPIDPPVFVLVLLLFYSGCI